ncbi:MAG TPA: AAA family ATPase [Gemmatimonadaceae bacterium]|nr:AAA family ATPase [Gemmatimonadaceae bacterium]
MSRAPKPPQEPRFPLIGPAELAAPVPPVDFLIDGLWPAGSFGPWGGPKKSLKTYCASIASIAVAAGLPAFNHWRVPRAAPVIYFGGEGGRAMHARRLQRIARDVYGVDLGTLPFYLVTGVGPFNSREFREEVGEHIDALEPGLIVLDSLYNYHPAGIEAGNLYERGRMLSDLSHPLTEAGTALWVVDHFNKTGSDKGLDLDRLAQAGMAAWADSWLLLDHRTPARVGEGRFSLKADVGSRQWGGTTWEIDLDIGPFDPEAGAHTSPIKVSVDRAGSLAASGSPSGRLLSRDDLMALVIEAVTERPRRTRNAYLSDLAAEHRVGRERVKDAWAALAEDNALVAAPGKVPEGGREVTREVWEVGTRRVRKGRATRPDGAADKSSSPVPRAGPASKSTSPRRPTGKGG